VSLAGGGSVGSAAGGNFGCKAHIQPMTWTPGAERLPLAEEALASEKGPNAVAGSGPVREASIPLEVMVRLLMAMSAVGTKENAPVGGVVGCAADGPPAVCPAEPALGAADEFAEPEDGFAELDTAATAAGPEA
jgi:hypothetical protein